MIKFFRKIRQNLLIENKTGKYFKYAIGEILLVVIGILIALQINNWNENRKLSNKKQELIINLIDDFEENFNLLKSEIDYSQGLQIKIDAFFENGYSDNLKIPLDSLKTLSDAFFRPSTFFPLMTSYDEAKESGNLTLLKNKELSQEFTSFQRNLSTYNGLKEQKLNSFFNGSIWDLKKSIGTLDYIRGVKRIYSQKQLDVGEYTKLIKTPLVLATLENQSTLNHNNLNALKRMKINSELILRHLKDFKK
jgi:hypothetical protein